MHHMFCITERYERESTLIRTILFTYISAKLLEVKSELDINNLINK